MGNHPIQRQPSRSHQY